MNWNGKANVVAGTVTTDTNAYADGDVVGSVITLGNAVREPKTGILNSITLLSDGASVSPALDILVFDRDPTGISGTPATVTNNAAFAWGDAAQYLLGVISVASADWSTALAAKQLVTNDAIALQIKALSLGVYLVFIAKGAATFGSNAVIRLKAGFIQD